ncbi:hypothetical protein ACQKMZ_24680 [Bacillus paramycoides]|uniref:hypothetical protein n=1 Tax=Bacillus paramycoides TaxID=2026194 RepID=UPI003CFFC302
MLQLFVCPKWGLANMDIASGDIKRKNTRRVRMKKFFTGNLSVVVILTCMSLQEPLLDDKQVTINIMKKLKKWI